MSSHYIVVTDLDGTLLDHHTYSWAEAAQALELLSAKGIPLVLCSSKTAAEMASLREALGTSDPYIVENGAAIYLPDGDAGGQGPQIIGFGMNRADILPIVARAREATGARFTGFSEMDTAAVMAATGLDATSAANALERRFTEPLLWQDSEEKRAELIRFLHEAGLVTVQGGRFLHVSGGGDKGRAVDWLRDYYGRCRGSVPKVIALGDSENDVSMLETADLPVLVKSPVKAFPEVDNPRVYRTRGVGPAGWNEAVLKILDQ